MVLNTPLVPEAVYVLSLKLFFRHTRQLLIGGVDLDGPPFGIGNVYAVMKQVENAVHMTAENIESLFFGNGHGLSRAVSTRFPPRIAVIFRGAGRPPASPVSFLLRSSLLFESRQHQPPSYPRKENVNKPVDPPVAHRMPLALQSAVGIDETGIFFQEECNRHGPFPSESRMDATRSGGIMDRKTAILRAAQELFAEFGYSGTTMKAISEHAGVSFGLLSHYFGNKEGLFLAAGSRMIDEMGEAIAVRTGRARNGLEAVELLVRAYLEFTLNNRTTFPTMIRCSPFSDDNPHLDRTGIGDKFQELIRAISACLERGLQDGSIRTVSPQQEAHVVYGVLVGAVRTEFLTSFEIEGLYERTVQFIVRSLTAN
jgi:AcrR family transcriptional regulator